MGRKIFVFGRTCFLAWFWVYHSQISFIRSVNHLTTCFIALNGYRISSEDTVITSLNSPNKIWVARSVLLGCTEWAVVSTEWNTRVRNYQTLPNQHQKAWMGCSLTYIRVCFLCCLYVVEWLKFYTCLKFVPFSTRDPRKF